MAILAETSWKKRHFFEDVWAKTPILVCGSHARARPRAAPPENERLENREKIIEVQTCYILGVEN